MNQLVKLLHITPRTNLPSIFRTGLNPAFARGRLRAVWLCSSSLTEWAIAHVAQRHSVPEGEVAVLHLRIPRSALRRRKRGVWIVQDIVNPRFIYGVNGLVVV